MRYNVEDIEDQLIATLQARAGLVGVNIRTHAGEINPQTFLDDQALSEFIVNLPCILIQYTGRRYTTKDSPAQMYLHELSFRLYVGAQSLREKQEGQRSAYGLLREIYDGLHGKVPKSSPQKLAGISNVLDGTAITTSGFNPQSPMMEAGGPDERLLVNLPGTVVYSTDYTLRLQA